MKPVFVALTAAGLATAHRCAAALGGEVHALRNLPLEGRSSGTGGAVREGVAAPAEVDRGTLTQTEEASDRLEYRSTEPAAHPLPERLRRSRPPLKGEVGESATVDLVFTDTTAHLRALFASGRPIVGICAAGILIRILAPLLADKREEPSVIAVSEDGMEVVPLLGGHRGANELAQKIAAVLDGHAAITTAGDRRFGVALDAPPAGWVLANPQDAKPVMAALLAGATARLEGDCPWLAASGLPLAADGAIRLVATTGLMTGDERTLVFHPKRLAVGLGCERDADPAEALALLRTSLAEAGLAPAAIACVASVDLKADEPAILEAAESLGVAARFFTVAALEAETPRLKNPSETVYREIGAHGVAEAAALAVAGPQARLVVAKRKSRRVTCAIAEAPGPITPGDHGRARGRLAVIGIGPGSPGWLTPEAHALLTASDAAVGYSLYLDLVANIMPGAERFDSDLGSEEARAREALQLAGEGRSVALISSGDAGIYAMATLVFELLDRSAQDLHSFSPECRASASSPPWGEAESARSAEPGLRRAEAASAAQAGEGAASDTDAPSPHPLGLRRVGLSPEERGKYGELSNGAHRVEIVVSPGISAMQAAAARAGAPLGHDFCAISLSDLLTPWEAIEGRIRAAAAGDFVIAFYNPVSLRRRSQLAEAKAILLKHRPRDTVVILARNLGRDGESITTIPLSGLEVDMVDMLTLVLVGASTTRQVTAAGKTWTYTPRGYHKKRNADAAE